MRVELKLGGLITVGERSLAMGRTFALLDGIAQEGAIGGAARLLEVSDAAAWERLAVLEGALGRPVARREGTEGRASLTPYGAGLREAIAETLRAFEPLVETETRRLQERLTALDGPHDPAA
ncbi:LysR family transcriptional regulator [Salinarimonas soli]|nr:LysR family transcriptional regulator [Salinarimonas soli]